MKSPETRGIGSELTNLSCFIEDLQVIEYS